MFDLLTDSELHERTLTAAKSERGATLLLLEHLLETDRRGSYLPSHRSMWEYVQNGLGYSSEQTNERMMAFRCFKKIPEAKAAVEANTLCLTSAANIGKVIHREKSSPEAAKQLFEACDGKSTREVKRILLPDEATPKSDSVRPIAKNLTVIKMEVGPDFMATLERGKELSGEFAVQALIYKALNEFVKKRELRDPNPKPGKSTPPTPVKLKAKSKPAPTPTAQPGTHAHESSLPEIPAELIVPKGRHIPAANVRTVRSRSNDRCEFEDPANKRRCGARAFLQFHHLNPYALFGSHHPDNLMHLCSAHHAWLEESHRRSSYGEGTRTVGR